MSLDLTKPLQVRHKEEYYPVIAAIPMTRSSIHVYWDEGGFTHFSHFSHDDGLALHLDASLENIPERRVFERWVNVFKNSAGKIEEWGYTDKADAETQADEYRRTLVARCLHIRHEYTVGAGL